ncbi:hypothetical protein [Nitrosopumilus sp.]|uniref:hypothetical protein n=1 Tax=Nitrosopumilus sp. TaxID=2024843 RepID=UPI003D139662
MKDTSCRKCGDQLYVYKKCNVCFKPNQFTCGKLGHTTDEEIHMKCIMIDMDHTILSS